MKCIVLSLPIIGAGGVGILYENSKEKASKALKERWILIVDKNDTGWGKIFDSFKAKTSSDFKSKGFQDFLEKTKNASTSPQVDKGNLYDFCESQTETVYKTLFGEDENLVEDIIKACAIANKDITGLEGNDIDKNKLDDDLLKNYSDNDVQLDKSLQDAKTKLSGSDGDKDEAKTAQYNWCNNKAYSKYRGSNSSDYKIFSKICKKKANGG